MLSYTELASKREKYLGSNLKLSYKKPLCILRGEGSYLFDDKNERYLDAYNNIAHVGHSNRYVTEAISKQIQTLNTNTRYLNPLIINYCEKLLEILNENSYSKHLDTFYFVNSGSEANDLAYRISEKVTGHKKVVALMGSYHGITKITTEMSDLKKSIHQENEFCEFIDPDLKLEIKSRKIAMSISEVIVGASGNKEVKPGFLNELEQKTHQLSGLFVIDEVQTGLYRMGLDAFAFLKHQVKPDILVLGKPMGNGFPLGIVITTKSIASEFSKGAEFFSSFGGSTLSMAAGLGVLEAIKKDGLIGHSETVGKELSQRLNILGRGLYFGLYVGEEHSKNMVERLKNEYKILVGEENGVIRIKPPLVFDQIDTLVTSVTSLGLEFGGTSLGSEISLPL